MKTLISFLLFSLPVVSFGQDLYLKMDDSAPREWCKGWKPVYQTTKLSKGYGYHSYICGPILYFVCEDKATLSQTLPASSIANYQIKTIEQLETDMVGKTHREVNIYLRSLQNIYIVEILPNNTIEVSKVKLSVVFK